MFLSHLIKNKLYRLIQEAGFIPISFIWSEDISNYKNYASVPEIEHISSKFYFIIDNVGDNHVNSWVVRYSPKPQDPKQIIMDVGSISSGRILSENIEVEFTRWLRNIKLILEELEEPDLWEQLSKQQLPHGKTVPIEITNEPFTPNEIERIKSGLNQIRAYIEEHVQASEEQLKAVNEELDYLTDAVERINRKDWRNSCIGTIIIIIGILQLSQEQAKPIWDLIVNALRVIQLLP